MWRFIRHYSRSQVSSGQSLVANRANKASSGNRCGVVLFNLAYLCDANWWTLAAALRDIVTRTAAILHLTPSGKDFDYHITIL
jgi:hypothetical protein